MTDVLVLGGSNDPFYTHCGEKCKNISMCYKTILETDPSTINVINFSLFDIRAGNSIIKIWYEVHYCAGLCLCYECVFGRDVTGATKRGIWVWDNNAGA